MAHSLAPQTAADLDDIWYYVAKESGSIETPIGSSTRLPTVSYCWPGIPTWADPATMILAVAREVFPSENMSSSIVSERMRFRSFAWHTVAVIWARYSKIRS